MSKYELEITYKVIINSESVFQKAFKQAQDSGYDYGDAGPLKTLKRFLVHEGYDVVFPEESTEISDVQLKTCD